MTQHQFTPPPQGGTYTLDKNNKPVRDKRVEPKLQSATPKRSKS